MKVVTLRRIALASVSLTALCGLSSGAFAQEATAPEAEQARSPSEDAGTADASDIVVTGSRIERDGSRAPTPVTTLSVDQLIASRPSNIPDALNQLPQFAGSRSNTQSIQVVGVSPDAGNYLNLRNVGLNRSLVLLDSRRVPPTSFEGAVDTNVLPQLLVQRVDVVTAGASAVYGSDAITGVVNYILDTKFVGIKGLLNAGVSTYGDDASYRAGLAVGFAPMDGRLHILASGEYYKSDGIGDLSDRPLGRTFPGRGGGGTIANPYFDFPNARLSALTFGGKPTGPLAGYQFVNNNGVSALVPFNNGIVRTGSLQEGGDGVPFTQRTIAGSLETKNLFGRAAFDVSDSLTVFVQGIWSQSKNGYDCCESFHFSGIRIFDDNAYLPQNAKDLLAAAPATSFTMGRMDTDFGRLHVETKNRYWNVVAGLQGNIGSWKWDASYQHGSSLMQTRESNDPDNLRLAAATDAVFDTVTQKTVCRVTLTNPGLYPGCVPINLFGNGAPTQAALNYIMGTSAFDVRNTLDEFSVNARGPLFDMLAGAVQVAFGGSWRKQTLVQTSNSDPAIPLDITGLRGLTTASAAAAGRFLHTNVGIGAGSNTVKEIYAEVDVPVLKDSPLGQSLSLNGAVRYADYRISGGAWTWKVGAQYQPIDWLGFRTTYSRDFRAPTLYDQFAGLTTNILAGPLDPLTGATGWVGQTSSSGNQNLRPEKGRTFTAGIILRPTTGLTLSVDYYNLKITDTIGAVGVLDQLRACTQSSGTHPICANIVRPLGPTNPAPGNTPSSVFIGPVNLGSLQTSGIDVDLGYRTEVGRGMLSARLLANYLIDYTTDNGVGLRLQTAGFNNNLKFRLTGTLGYDIGRFGSSVQVRYQSKSDQNFNNLVYERRYLPAAAYVDLDLRYKLPSLGKDTSVFLHINNLFNKQPISVGQPFPGLVYPTNQVLYDIVGRYFTVGTKFKF
jgi:outer membrane receptor protein involved in Fe transport